MLRRFIVTIATVAALGISFGATNASAKDGHPAWYGHGHRHVVGHHHGYRVGYHGLYGVRYHGGYGYRAGYRVGYYGGYGIGYHGGYGGGCCGGFNECRGLFGCGGWGLQPVHDYHYGCGAGPHYGY